MKIGIVLEKIPDSNIFVVDIGWGQLRYFSSKKGYSKGDIILYIPWSKVDCYEISDICRFEDCEFLGIAIARKGSFVYREKYGSETQFDKVSNCLLFSTYAEPKYPYPDEKEWLRAYIYAKNKVEELDIPKMIDEFKVEVHSSSWTRRGSDNIMFAHSWICYDYDEISRELNDPYLDAIFPKYTESLYSSKDDDYEYINPKYEKEIKTNWIDGSREIIILPKI